MSRDPIGVSEAQACHNSYLGIDNAPTLYIDPDGQETLRAQSSSRGSGESADRSTDGADITGIAEVISPGLGVLLPMEQCMVGVVAGSLIAYPPGQYDGAWRHCYVTCQGIKTCGWKSCGMPFGQEIGQLISAYLKKFMGMPEPPWRDESPWEGFVGDCASNMRGLCCGAKNEGCASCCNKH